MRQGINRYQCPVYLGKSEMSIPWNVQVNRWRHRVTWHSRWLAERTQTKQCCNFFYCTAPNSESIFLLISCLSSFDEGLHVMWCPCTRVVDFHAGRHNISLFTNTITTLAIIKRLRFNRNLPVGKLALVPNWVSYRQPPEHGYQTTRYFNISSVVLHKINTTGPTVDGVHIICPWTPRA